MPQLGRALLIGCRRIVIILRILREVSVSPDDPARKPLIWFGDAVRVRRLDLGLSQEMLAERSGLHRTYIGGVERGERNVGLLNIWRLARALDVVPGALLEGREAAGAMTNAGAD